mmetsp:Transcript_33552/g.77363  ORF Transcript_33552/g.77363 Transcript_33552/m.77363 type:complete len:166 (-) Transcript_33552:39-536(-)
MMSDSALAYFESNDSTALRLSESNESAGDFPKTLASRRRRRPEFNILSRVSNFHMTNEKNWFELTVEVPGIKSKNLSITVDRGVLRLSGSRRIISANGRVRRNFKFIKSFSLDDDVDTNRLNVHLSHGVLVVSGPKIQPSHSTDSSRTSPDTPQRTELQAETSAQ